MKTVLHILLTIAQFLLSFVVDLIAALYNKLTTRKPFNAEFGSERSLGSRFNKGFVFSKHRQLSRLKSFENLLIVGPTGSGKSVRLIIPFLFRIKNAVIIINDPSKGIFNIVAGYLAKFFCIKCISWTDSAVSNGYNPLSEVKKPSDADRLAYILIATGLEQGKSPGSDPFWNLQARVILSILIKLTLCQEELFRNLANVAHLLHIFSATPEKIDAMIAKTNDERLITQYKSFISTPEKVQLSIIATAKSAMQLFDHPEIGKTTSINTSINFDTLRSSPCIIFLHSSIGEQAYLKSLTSIFFEQLYNHLLHQLPKSQELDVFIVMEEASSLVVPLLPMALANLRKHRSGSLICIQNPEQLKSNYGSEAPNIVGNCVTKLYLPGLTSMDVLKEIETLSGKCIYRDEKNIERTRSLITADEVRLLHRNRSIILSGNLPVIMGKTMPYYRSLIFQKYARIEPIKFVGDIPDGPVVLLK